MTKTSAHEDPNPWVQRWSEHKTGWNMGQAHPYLSVLLERSVCEGGLQPGGRIYVPGCGHGHEAVALARQAYQVVAVDFVAQAIEEACHLYGKEANLNLQQADVLQWEEAEQDSFEAVIDRAMLCALQPENRKSYVDACRARLKPGGLFAGILFAKVNLEGAGGPPFDIDEKEIWDLWSDGFDLVHLESRPAAQNSPPVIVSEWLCVWRKWD
ncbi:MAG: methyltransferase domain-containing protein [Oligoflexus sp.]